MPKAKTYTMIVSCSLAGGRYRAGQHFKHGSDTYELTKAQIAAVKNDSVLAIADVATKTAETAQQIRAEFDGMDMETLYDLIEDMVKAYNTKAEGEGGVSISTIPSTELQALVEVSGKAAEAPQTPKAGNTPEKAAKGQEGSKDKAQDPKGQKAEAKKDDAAPLPAKFPHAAAFSGKTLAEVRGMRDSGTLAAHPGMDAVKAAEVSEALDAIDKGAK